MDKKTLSIVSYITIIGWVVAFIVYGGKTEKSSLEKFHLEQSLGLGILGVLNSIASIIVVPASDDCRYGLFWKKCYTEP